MTSASSPTSPKYTQVGEDGTTIFGAGGKMKAVVKEAAFQTFDALRRGITNKGRSSYDWEGKETQKLVDGDEATDGPQLATKKFIRRSRKDVGHWCHVEAMLESVKHNCPMRIMYAFEHGIRSILAKPDLTLLDIEDCLLTALFLELIGCKVDFAYIHAIKLSAHPAASPLQKKIGYLLCSMCMDQKDEKTILLVNNIHKDLMASDSATISTALRAAAKCVPPQHYDMLLPLIWKHADNTTDIYVRKLALVTLHSFLIKQCGFQRTPDVDASCRLQLVSTPAVPCSDTIFSAKNKNDLLVNLLKASGKGSHLVTMELCRTLIVHTTESETPDLSQSVPLDVSFEVLEHIFEFGKRNFFSNGEAASPHVKICMLQISWLRLLAVALAGAVQIPEFPQVMDEICEYHRTNMDSISNATKYEMVRLAASEPYISVFKGTKTPKISMFLSSLFAFADSLIYIDSSSSEDESSPSSRRRKSKKDPTEMELNMTYISVRCISYLSNCDRDRGMSRHAPVLRGLVSSDPTVLLASIDVLCAAAREANVRAILKQLLNFIRKPPSRITNFATINNLRVALVGRANELSWRVAKVTNPELHLKATSLLLTHCSSSMFGVESEEELQGFAILDWLHEELSLKVGEPIFGHGDLELRLDLPQNTTAAREGAERNTFRRQVCKHMLTTLEVYTKNLHNGLSRFAYRNDPIFQPPTEPILVRVASWVIGEFGPAFAPSDCQLNELFILLIENLHGSLSPAPGVIMAMSKIIFLYAQLRLTEQPIVINGRDTSLSVDAVTEAEEILEKKMLSRDTTVASTAGETLFLIKYAINALKSFKKSNASLSPTNTEDIAIFEELSLPFSTAIAQESDSTLSFLDGFVKSQTTLLENNGKVVKPYIKLSEREERIVTPDIDDGLELRNDTNCNDIRKLLGTSTDDPVLDLIAPASGPWGKGGYGVNATPERQAEELVLNSPNSQQAPSFPKKKPRTRRKKTNAWFREAVELATAKSGRRPKIAKAVHEERGLTGSGTQFRWGAPTGGMIPSVPQYQMIGENDEIDPCSPIRSVFGDSMSDVTDGLQYSGDEYDTPRSRPGSAMSAGSSNRGFFRGFG
eukprot:TRINITY_DN281_c5_g1_i1.p1 TRINITY_DN281_c5_g1~~TRINITY_DN281_c5_g1_i1.p1  ORF type:complete len:1097 (+),score=168.94 TRINITY_DN281_c5_g1_i1:45-3335(+)